MEQNRPLAEQAAQALIDYIVEHELKPGDKLPTEPKLSELLNVGRSTVREAVKLLKSRNVVEVRQGAGTFLAENGLGVAEDPLGFTFIKDKEKLLGDLLDIRLILEPRIAAMAAVKASEADIAELKLLCQETEDLILAGEDHLKKDMAFHRKLAECSQNLVVPNLQPILQQSVEYSGNMTHQELNQETIEIHRAIMDAIEARDAMAASDAMTLHIIYNRNFLKRHL